MTELYTIIWIFVTLVLIGFFAGYEIAFVTGNRLSIELKKKQGKRSGIILSNFLEHPARLIGSCLVGLNIFLVIYGLLFHDLLKRTLWNPLQFQNEYLKLAFDTFLSSLVVLVIGEFLPKAIFRARNDSLLSFFAPVAKLFYNLFNPISSLFVKFAEAILKYLFNVRIKDKGEP